MSRSTFVPVSSLTLALMLLLPSALVHAEEPTLLEQLSAESADVAARARTAVVPVVSGARGGHGVVVGSPPLLVVPYEVAQEFQEILLDENSQIPAQRIDGDAGLGIAVYKLPEDEADRWQPIELEREWTARRGSLAVSAGPSLSLLIVSEVDAVRGVLRVSGSLRDAVLLSPRGGLLGLRAQAEPAYTGNPWWNPYCNSSPWGNTVRYATSLGTVQCPPLIISYFDSVAAVNGRPIAGYSSVPYYNDSVVSQDNAFDSLPPGSYTIHTPVEPAVVPGPVIARVIQDIQKHGRIRHAYVGVVPSSEVGEDGTTRMFLSAVLPDSPAEKAGLKASDVVTAIQGRPVADLGSFERVISLLRPGEVLRVQVLGRDEEVKVVLEERSEARGRLVTPQDVGLEVVGLTTELNFWLELPTDQTGAVVRTVRDESAAALAGVVKGDVIQQVAGHLTRDAGELEAALAGATGNIIVVLSRGGTTLNVTLTLPEPAAPSGAR